eukprot:m.22726 g.22726  ORF g.22726 m.22726 type:complete len:412 (-) comp4026_c0_seq1:601-1836(-)
MPALLLPPPVDNKGPGRRNFFARGWEKRVGGRGEGRQTFKPQRRTHRKTGTAVLEVERECYPLLRLQGDVAVLAPRAVLARASEHLKIGAQARACRAGKNDVVDKAAVSSGEGRGKSVNVLGLALSDVGIAAEDNIDSALGTHDGNLGLGPGVVDIATEMLRAHDIVGTAVGLAGDDSELGDCGLGVGIEQLGAVTDNTTVLLTSTGEKAGDIDKRDQRNVECITEAHKASALDRGVDIEGTRAVQRLVGNDTHGATTKAAKANDNVLGVRVLDLKKVVLVDNLGDDILHVIGLVRVGGGNRVERLDDAVLGVLGAHNRGLLAVAGGQKVDELAGASKGLNFVFKGKVGNTRLGRVRLGATKLLLGHHLVGDRLDHIRASDEEKGRVLDHAGKVSHGRRVDGATSARAHDE